MVTKKNSRNPWAWIPTLYFAEGLPNVIVTALSVVMYMQLGLTDAEVGLYTGWLALPWVIKPLWSPFIDLLKTKRWWVLTMQALIGAALAGIAWLWVIAAGIMGTSGHMLWTRALKIGEVSALTPISFMQLPVVALLGWLLFDQGVDRWTIIGAGIILAANAYIAHREAVLARRAATSAPVEAAKPGE